ncbi:MAG: hypothetical protein JJE02_10750 [Propionibacteriales bacterium]|nr:hypothetical protein [Propionibacteriales bacterium]
MASSTEVELRQEIAEASGIDATWMSLGVINDQHATVEADVRKIRSHPLIPDNVLVGGFLYDVNTGLLEPLT